MKNKEILLAFSGGLDTSFCVKYLMDKGYNVHAALVNTGGFTPQELKEVEERATFLGVKTFKVLEETESYYQDVVRFLIYGNVLKNGSYPLSVSAERVSQAVALAKYAKKLKVQAIAHGSTGAGNDQVRFDMIFQTFLPGVEILTPVRDFKLSREEEIELLRSKGVNWDFTKSAYSINKGLWGTSIGGKETLQSLGNIPEEAWPTQVTKTQAENLTLHFEKGEMKGVNDKLFKHAHEAIQALNDIAAPFGIGRDIHVGDTIIGMKGRVAFEAAAAILTIKGHHAIEKHVLSKWQLYWKDQIAQFYGNWLHEGQYLDPVMRDLEAMMESAQAYVTGTAHFTLYPYRFELNGITSEHDLMHAQFGTYGEMNKAWSGSDVRGFAKIFGNQNAMFHQINEKS